MTPLGVGPLTGLSRFNLPAPLEAGVALSVLETREKPLSSPVGFGSLAGSNARRQLLRAGGSLAGHAVQPATPAASEPVMARGPCTGTAVSRSPGRALSVFPVARSPAGGCRYTSLHTGLVRSPAHEDRCRGRSSLITSTAPMEVGAGGPAVAFRELAPGRALGEVQSECRPAVPTPRTSSSDVQGRRGWASGSRSERPRHCPIPARWAGDAPASEHRASLSLRSRPSSPREPLTGTPGVTAASCLAVPQPRWGCTEGVHKLAHLGRGHRYGYMMPYLWCACVKCPRSCPLQVCECLSQTLDLTASHVEILLMIPTSETTGPFPGTAYATSSAGHLGAPRTGRGSRSLPPLPSS